MVNVICLAACIFWLIQGCIALANNTPVNTGTYIVLAIVCTLHYVLECLENNKRK